MSQNLFELLIGAREVECFVFVLSAVDEVVFISYLQVFVMFP